MHILGEIYDKAKLNPARMAFPEAENEKMLQAISQATQEGLIIPYLIGNKAAVESKCKKLGINSQMFNIIDTTDESLYDNLAERYSALPNAIYSKKLIIKRLTNPLYYALVLEALDEVDCTFAGIETTTGEVILAGQTIVGLKEGVQNISSFGILEIPGFEGSEGEFLAFGDSAVSQNPTAEELASMAIEISDAVHSLVDWEPRCALLSYSTKGSSNGPLVEKVKEAVTIANDKRPDLNIEGEFQLDSAIIPKVASKKVAGKSEVAGKANIIIFPDLNAGNIVVKSAQIFGNADAYGPTLIGFNKIVADCSRSAPVSEIVGNIAISSVRSKY